jgi:hypothetical protein
MAPETETGRTRTDQMKRNTGKQVKLAGTAIMIDTNYPGVLAACAEADKQHARKLWQIGDAIIKDIGPPADEDTDRRNMIRVVKELQAKLDPDWQYFDPSWPKSESHAPRRRWRILHEIYLTAYAYPPPDRLAEYRFDIHQAAGDRDTLDDIIASAKKKRVPVTSEFACAARTRMRS